MLQRGSFGAHPAHSSVGMFCVGAALSPVSGQGCCSQGGLCALEGTNAGKGAVLGDLLQVPSVPLITGKLLSIPTL